MYFQFIFKLMYMIQLAHKYFYYFPLNNLWYLSLE